MTKLSLFKTLFLQILIITASCSLTNQEDNTKIKEIGELLHQYEDVINDLLPIFKYLSSKEIENLNSDDLLSQLENLKKHNSELNKQLTELRIENKEEIETIEKKIKIQEAELKKLKNKIDRLKKELKKANDIKKNTSKLYFIYINLVTRISLEDKSTVKHLNPAIICSCKYNDISYLTGDANGLIELRDSSTHDVNKKLEPSHKELINSITISLNREHIFTSSRNGTIGVWKYKTLEFIKFIYTQDPVYYTTSLSNNYIISSSVSKIYVIDAKKPWDIIHTEHINENNSKLIISQVKVTDHNKLSFISIGDKGSIIHWNLSIKNKDERTLKIIKKIKIEGKKLISIIKLPNYYVVNSDYGLILLNSDLELMGDNYLKILNSSKSNILPYFEEDTMNSFVYFDQINTLRIISISSSEMFEENFSFQLNDFLDETFNYTSFFKQSDTSIIAINNNIFIDFEVKIDI